MSIDDAFYHNLTLFPHLSFGKGREITRQFSGLRPRNLQSSAPALYSRQTVAAGLDGKEDEWE
jgi:hypothetical protein